MKISLKLVAITTAGIVMWTILELIRELSKTTEKLGYNGGLVFWCVAPLLFIVMCVIVFTVFLKFGILEDDDEEKQKNDEQ